MRERLEAPEWITEQVRNLLQLGRQGAHQVAARDLVEMCKQELFGASLMLFVTRAFMAWLNGLGLKAVSFRSQDMDLVRRHKPRLAVPHSF